MKTISDYAIYCTEAQTKKALELGAPIVIFSDREMPETAAKSFHMVIQYGRTYIIPTTEQMIGWLEEQGILIDIHFYCVSWDMGVRTKTGNIFHQKMAIDTRKAATIAAIDAALEYLSNKKE